MKVNLEGAEEFALVVADLVIQKLKGQDSAEENDFLNVDQVANLIGYQKTSIYGLVQKNKIPYHKKGKLFFLKSEIVDWLKAGKKISSREIEKKANDYLMNQIL